MKSVRKVEYHAGKVVTHVCAICGGNEYPEAEVATRDFWICDDCLDTLRVLVKKAEPQIGKGY